MAAFSFGIATTSLSARTGPSSNCFRPTIFSIGWNKEDRLIELEALQKALQEGVEAYDKMQAELITAKASLTKILTSKNIKATLLEVVERHEISRPLLALLDENIANAHRNNKIVAIQNSFSTE